MRPLLSPRGNRFLSLSLLSSPRRTTFRPLAEDAETIVYEMIMAVRYEVARGRAPAVRHLDWLVGSWQLQKAAAARCCCDYTRTCELPLVLASSFRPRMVAIAKRFGPGQSIRFAWIPPPPISAIFHNFWNLDSSQGQRYNLMFKCIVRCPLLPARYSINNTLFDHG